MIHLIGDCRELLNAERHNLALKKMAAFVGRRRRRSCTKREVVEGSGPSLPLRRISARSGDTGNAPSPGVKGGREGSGKTIGRCRREGAKTTSLNGPASPTEVLEAAIKAATWRAALKDSSLAQSGSLRAQRSLIRTSLEDFAGDLQFERAKKRRKRGESVQEAEWGECSSDTDSSANSESCLPRADLRGETEREKHAASAPREKRR